jgi:alkylation response protein AidB-like acyl-CoA dehydrogenase
VIRWNADQVALRDGLARWYDALNTDHIAQDAEAAFPWDKWKLIQRSGLLGLPFDERWGGLGQDLLTTMYVLEGLGYGCRDGGLSFAVTTHMVSTGVPLQRFGSAELKERYLARVCAGDAIGCHAVTEPQGGSDALAMRTRATRDGDHYVLEGSKTFVSNGPVADLFVVYARTHPDGGPLGVTAFLVERGMPGFEIGPPIGKMGLKTAPVSELFFDGCRVPAANVIGRPGGGFLVLDHVMQREILCSFIVNVGEMQHQLERCIDYARTRTQFGKAIGKYQAIANRIVDMRIRVETARKWLYDTAARLLDGETVTVDIAISKLLTSEGNVASSLSAVQIFGAHGYTTEYGIEKDLRNAVAGTIYSGTTEIQYNRIASMLGL